MTKQTPFNHYGELAPDDYQLAERAGAFYLFSRDEDHPENAFQGPLRVDFERPVLVGPAVCSVPVLIERRGDAPAHVNVTHDGLLWLRHVLDHTPLRQIGGSPFALRLQLQPGINALWDVLALLQRDVAARDLQQRLTHARKMRHG